MTLYDSSVLIEYLDGTSTVVDYVTDHADERAVAPPLVLFEVYQGEVYTSGPAEFDAIDAALEWIEVIPMTHDFARAAAALQDSLHARGETLSARDAYIAGAAVGQDERLAVADADFGVPGLESVVDVDLVSTNRDG